MEMSATATLRGKVGGYVACREARDHIQILHKPGRNGERGKGEGGWLRTRGPGVRPVRCWRLIFTLRAPSGACLEVMPSSGRCF